jgi:hypothetical protein
VADVSALAANSLREAISAMISGGFCFASMETARLSHDGSRATSRESGRDQFGFRFAVDRKLHLCECGCAFSVEGCPKPRAQRGTECSA